MTSLAEPLRVVTVGVDTHSEIHVAAVLDERGALLDTSGFGTTAAGHRQLLEWAEGFGALDRFGVEGTGSWGAGLSRFLMARGHNVIDVNRPNRSERRRAGKSDDLDAIAAARAAQSGQASALAKSKEGAVESIRVLRLARNGAVKARTQAANALHALVATAPDELRGRLRDLSRRRLVACCARFRAGTHPGPAADTRMAMRSVARRYQHLTHEIDELNGRLAQLTSTTAPTLVAMVGVGSDIAGQLLVTAGDNPDRLRSEAAFARLCGVAPIPASSGKTSRHRLHRGGDRQANAALHRAVIVRLHHDPDTRAYLNKRISDGLTKTEAIRCLKRFLARRVYHAIIKDLTGPKPAPQTPSEPPTGPAPPNGAAHRPPPPACPD